MWGTFLSPTGLQFFYFQGGRDLEVYVSCSSAPAEHLRWHCAYKGVLSGTGQRDLAGDSCWTLAEFRVIFCFAHVSLCFGAVFLVCPFVLVPQLVWLIILFTWCLIHYLVSSWLFILPVWLGCLVLPMLWLCLLVCLTIKYYWTHNLSTTVYKSCSGFHGKRHYLFFNFCREVYYAFITLEYIFIIYIYFV